MIKAIIIDDEQNAREYIRQVLNELDDHIEIIGEADDVESGVQVIKRNPPDLLLTDIVLPDGNSFDILDELDKIDFKIIFITAHQEHALHAFKFSAVDYILKPFSVDELKSAIERVVHLIQAEYLLKLDTLIHNNQTNNQNEKRLVIKTVGKLHVVKISDIYRCESDQSYCHFYLTDGLKITISKPLKDYDDLLNGYSFFRIHKSHLINLRHVKRFERTEGGLVVMADDTKVPVSFRKREDLIKKLEHL